MLLGGPLWYSPRTLKDVRAQSTPVALAPTESSTAWVGTDHATSRCGGQNQIQALESWKEAGDQSMAKPGALLLTV